MKRGRAAAIWIATLSCLAGLAVIVVAVVSAGGVEGGWFGWAVLAVLIVGFPYSTIRVYKRGPALGWLPRRWRPRVSKWYLEHGWEDPYDAENNKRHRPWWW